MSELENRYRGCLIGCAAGDALGAAVEFKKVGSFEPLTDMIDGGPWNLKAGQWTDDTSMALCLGESIVECQGMNATDQMQRYLRWYEEGYLSSTGVCFDTGLATRSAIIEFKQTGQPICGKEDPKKAGNGSIMRLAPVSMAYAFSSSEVRQKMHIDSSLTTHAAETCLDSCVVMGELISAILKTGDKINVSDDYFRKNISNQEVGTMLQDRKYLQSDSTKVGSKGFVLTTLEAALWAFYQTNDFKACVLAASNLGGDSDTIAAVAGSIAGAYYGESAIPQEWLQKITFIDLIRTQADNLLVFAQNQKF